MTTVGDLCDEMVCAVLSHLPPPSLCVASLVSAQWRRCCTDVSRRCWQTSSLALPASILQDAAAQGHTSLALWLHKRCGHPWTTASVRAAARNGHLHLVDCMLAGCTDRVPCAADCDPPDGERIVSRQRAACPNRLATVVDRHNGSTVSILDETVAAAAIIGGGHRLLRKVLARGCPVGPLAATVAVILSDRKSIDLLIGFGCACDALTVMSAVALCRKRMLARIDCTDVDVAEATDTLGAARLTGVGCDLPCCTVCVARLLVRFSGKARVDRTVAAGLCDKLVDWWVLGRPMKSGPLDAAPAETYDWNTMAMHQYVGYWCTWWHEGRAHPWSANIREETAAMRSDMISSGPSSLASVSQRHGARNGKVPSSLMGRRTGKPVRAEVGFRSPTRGA
ncbi:F-box domain containing protein [Pandoravirus neocaledonia]|uniref:F-box domain containing protein n=1 Tax=Pandoravirus neocaledonia TaxID=2107708 RepID=A0A2U7UDS1_9VIRU|nr:F-box domain containing protein [Pandoravirus neocaledonia]AVK76594.1 F-box domain containing protein [Pandoravirus neocaledonia]